MYTSFLRGTLCIPVLYITGILLKIFNVLYISSKVNNVEINPCENVKYLRVQINSQLTFNSHIRMIENKISKSIEIIIKLKSFLPPTALLESYYVLVHPHVLCGLLLWGTTYTSYLAKLYTLQNKLV